MFSKMKSIVKNFRYTDCFDTRMVVEMSRSPKGFCLTVV